MKRRAIRKVSRLFIQDEVRIPGASKALHHLVSGVVLTASELPNRLLNHGLKPDELLFVKIQLLIQISPLLVKSGLKRRRV